MGGGVWGVWGLMDLTVCCGLFRGVVNVGAHCCSDESFVCSWVICELWVVMSCELRVESWRCLI